MKQQLLLDTLKWNRKILGGQRHPTLRQVFQLRQYLGVSDAKKFLLDYQYNPFVAYCNNLTLLHTVIILHTYDL